MSAPVIGVTANLKRDEKGRFRHEVKNTYLAAIVRAGGIPLIMPAIPAQRAGLLALVDGVLMTGGDDIDTRPFGIELHPEAVIMEPDRQESEFALLKALESHRAMPTLGICLGMQLMGMHGGCALIQHLHDHYENGDRHRFDNVHDVKSELGSGPVASWHHQALKDEGSFEAIGWSDDGLLEAIRDASREFYVGVQWHPERTKDTALGHGIFVSFVEAARHHKVRKGLVHQGAR